MILRGIVESENKEHEKEIAAIIKTLKTTLADENVAIVSIALTRLLMEIIHEDRENADLVEFLESTLEEFQSH
jgi:hypothetical protein